MQEGMGLLWMESVLIGVSWPVDLIQVHIQSPDGLQQEQQAKSPTVPIQEHLQLGAPIEMWNEFNANTL